MTRERKMKITYRAIFEEPIGCMNPLGAKVGRVQVPVELRRFGYSMGSWIACKPGDRTPSAIFCEITAQPSAESLQSQMSMYFRRRVSDWEVWTADLPQRKLERHEYIMRDGQAYEAVPVKTGEHK